MWQWRKTKCMLPKWKISRSLEPFILLLRKICRIIPRVLNPCRGTCVSLPFVPDSLGSRGLQPTRLLTPWDFPGKDTGVPFGTTQMGILNVKQDQ